MDALPIYTKPIPNFEHYLITVNGDVYSTNNRLWRKSRVEDDGYSSIALFKEGKRSKFLVHRLVMLTFRPRDDARDMEVNHKDTIRSNNSLTNLEWCTHKENMDYRDHVTNTVRRGSKHGSAKLDESKVIYIRSLPSKNGLVEELAERFGVSVATIKYARYDSTRWKHV